MFGQLLLYIFTFALFVVVDNSNVKPINPTKGETEYGWHFEQQVYDVEGITRAVKAGGGSGNIPKALEGLRTSR